MNTTQATKFMVINPQTGCHVREATKSEAREYRRRNPHSTWEALTKLSTGVWVDTYNGPGIWFGGAGF